MFITLTGCADEGLTRVPRPWRHDRSDPYLPEFPSASDIDRKTAVVGDGRAADRRGTWNAMSAPDAVGFDLTVDDEVQSDVSHHLY